MKRLKSENNAQKWTSRKNVNINNAGMVTDSFSVAPEMTSALFIALHQKDRQGKSSVYGIEYNV